MQWIYNKNLKFYFLNINNHGDWITKEMIPENLKCFQPGSFWKLSSSYWSVQKSGRSSFSTKLNCLSIYFLITTSIFSAVKSNCKVLSALKFRGYVSSLHHFMERTFCEIIIIYYNKVYLNKIYLCKIYPNEKYLNPRKYIIIKYILMQWNIS